jgi:hypothetical protein
VLPAVAGGAVAGDVVAGVVTVAGDVLAGVVAGGSVITDGSVVVVAAPTLVVLAAVSPVDVELDAPGPDRVWLELQPAASTSVPVTRAARRIVRAVVERADMRVSFLDLGHSTDPRAVQLLHFFRP